MSLDKSIGRGAAAVNQKRDEESFYKPDAKTESIIFALSQELVSSNPNKEKICVYLLQLQNRGLEGQAALQYLASGSDYVSEQAGKYLEYISGNDGQETELFAGHLKLEKKLGINRLSNLVDRDKTSFADLKKVIYDYAVKHKLWLKEEGDMERFMKEVIEAEYRVHDGQITAQESADIEEEILASGATFGGNEPTYFEGLGPLRILELRAMKDPKFLLLGSLGRYSAKEFSLFANKINKNTQKNVIDLNPETGKYLGKMAENLGINFKVASATKMPYADNSLDLITTNHLFHHLMSEDSLAMGRPETILKVFQEAVRVLKPGGEMILVEQPYGNFIREMRFAHSDQYVKGIIKNIQADINSLALKAGFSKRAFGSEFDLYTFRADVSSAKIDEYGFPDYGGKLLSVSRMSGTAAKLIK